MDQLLPWLVLLLFTVSEASKDVTDVVGKFRLAPSERKRKDKQDCFIVKLRETVSHTRKKQLADFIDGTDTELFNASLNAFVKCNCRLLQLKRLAEYDDVEYLEEDSTHEVEFQQTTGPTYWNLDRVDQDALPLDNTFNYEYTGQGIPIYILDSGVNGAHEEFTNRMLPGVDIVGGGTVDPATDCNSHGTHCAGTAAGTRSGIAKEAFIVPVRVLGCDGSGTTSGIISGINWVMQNPRGVISMSLGGGSSLAMNNAVTNAVAANYIAVVAAGNANSDACGVSPASAPGAITVASVGRTDQRSSWSNFGSCVDIFAPGEGITSASNTDNMGYTVKSGTSMATPLVAGAVAAYLSANPSLTPDEMLTILQREATPGMVQDPQNSPNYLLKSSGVPSFDSRSPSPSPVSPSPSTSPVSSSPSPIGPDNDICPKAFPLPCDSTVSGSTMYAAYNPTSVICGTTHTGPEVWYYIQVPNNGEITLSMCNMANFDTKLTLWGGTCSEADISGLQCVAGADDTTGCGLTTSITQYVTAGQYFVMVHGYRQSMGNFQLQLTCPLSVGVPLPSDAPSDSPGEMPSPGPDPSDSESPSPSPSESPSPSPFPSRSPRPSRSPYPSPLPSPGHGKKGRSADEGIIEEEESSEEEDVEAEENALYGLIASTALLLGLVVGATLIICIAWKTIWPRFVARFSRNQRSRQLTPVDFRFGGTRQSSVAGSDRRSSNKPLMPSGRQVSPARQQHIEPHEDHENKPRRFSLIPPVMPVIERGMSAVANFRRPSTYSEMEENSDSDSGRHDGTFGRQVTRISPARASPTDRGGRMSPADRGGRMSPADRGGRSSP